MTRLRLHHPVHLAMYVPVYLSMSAVTHALITFACKYRFTNFPRKSDFQVKKFHGYIQYPLLIATYVH